MPAELTEYITTPEMLIYKEQQVFLVEGIPPRIYFLFSNKRKPAKISNFKFTKKLTDEQIDFLLNITV